MLDKQAQQRISDAADAFSHNVAHVTGYKAGATAEAERAAGLVEALEKVKRMCLATGPEADLRDRVINDILNTAEMELTKYNNSK